VNPNPDPPAPNVRGPVSSLFDKLSPRLREDLDRAIIQRDPPRLIDVYNLFGLASASIGEAAFYRYAARLRARASLEHYADLARAEDRDPIDSMSTVLDAEFIRLSTSDGSVPEHARTDANPYAIEESALKRLQRIVTMRKQLAVARLHAERAATHREDAELRRNNKLTRELAAALRAIAADSLERTERCLGSARQARAGNDSAPAADDAPHAVIPKGSE
jgi:hypothetical protein